MRICVLDDVEQVALRCADWESLGADEVAALEEHVDDEAELAAALAPFDVLVLQRERTRLTRTLVEALPRLRLVVTTGFRNAAIDLEACRDHDVVVSSTGGAQSPVVEHAWALILAALRDVPSRDASMRLGQWRPTAGRALEGATLGLLGLGRTGTRMARIGAAFGMDVVAWSENLTDEAAAERGARRVPRDELFAGSDVVSVHLLLSKRTRGLVSADDLRLMKPDAWLVNTSRGPIVDETALVTALREQWFAGAALDVFDEEPLPADHPLRTMPRTVLTPHVGYATVENYRSWYGLAVESIAAWRDGDPVRLLELP
jgi:phosphoglycerate dehydrogenase-like enzyme